MASSFVVDVTFASHQDLKDHRTAGWHRVVVLADDGDDATLIATQMVAATQDTMPVRADHCI